jgi:lysozyme family protein
MKRQPSIKTIEKRRQAKLSKLGLCGPFVTGSLNRVEKADKHGKVTVYHLLTFKEEGKTRSIYVPKDMVKEVRGWVRNYRKLKNAIARISTDSIGVIRGFVAQKRADAAKSPKPSSARQDKP